MSDGAAVAVCRALQDALGTAVTVPGDADYDAQRRENWSQTAWNTPSCITSPTNATAVQYIVQTLVAANIPFAIRSGGHSPNSGYANINRGVLISLSSLNKVSYHANTNTVDLSPGARWGQVYNYLEPHNVTVVGGRVLDVGVGGLLLGAGLSYYTDLYGMACDNILAYELVLADGRIVTASKSSHPDLFWALKGGSNNFGIVTRFTLAAYPLTQVWGGIRLYPASAISDVLDAYHAYHTAANKDLYANLHINLVPSNDTVIVTLIYLKPLTSPPAAFAPFYAEKLNTPLLEQMGPFSLVNLLALFNAGSVPRWEWSVNSFKPSPELWGDIEQILSPSSPEIVTLRGLQAGTLVSTVQPITSRVGDISASGNNPLGLQAVNQTWLSLNAGWWREEDDTIARGVVSVLHQRIRQAAEDRGGLLEYLFMNDAGSDQGVIASYGSENVERLQQVRVKGGQKIPELGGAVSARIVNHPDRSFAIEAHLDLIKGADFFKKKPPPHFHFQEEYIQATRGKIVLEINGEEQVFTPEDGRIAIKPYLDHRTYPVHISKQDEGVTVVSFLLSGEKTDSVFELNPVFFENWYRYQDDVLMNGGDGGKKIDMIQVLCTFDAGGTYITLPGPWWIPKFVKHSVAIALGVVVGRWIGSGLLGYQPFFKKWTTDWELACQKMESSIFQRRFADRSKQD
ncbi:bifunctional solanapyrone synthase [Podospora fimiseda]|uniref:Bifunctional solanapyrone synthase n=1 Tax=Podospora fimiseda TaxID=252190 RepID=A0AAN7BGQ5_9PEZI|nr:bifunctional solanapyrone synthase [Podospora fimiseda]